MIERSREELKKRASASSDVKVSIPIFGTKKVPVIGWVDKRGSVHAEDGVPKGQRPRSSFKGGPVYFEDEEE